MERIAKELKRADIEPAQDCKISMKWMDQQRTVSDEDQKQQQYKRILFFRHIVFLHG